MMHANKNILVFYSFIISTTFGKCESNVAEKRNDENYSLVTKDSDWISSDLESVLSEISNFVEIRNDTLKQQTQLETNSMLRMQLDHEKDLNQSHTLQERGDILQNIGNHVSKNLKKILKSRKLRSLSKQRVPDAVSDCADVFINGERKNGIYLVTPYWSSQVVRVYCDMETEGGGWTVLHRFAKADFNLNYFVRSWNEYTDGFGDLEADFWIGNKHISAFTRQGFYEVRFDLRTTFTTVTAVHEAFWIENEEQKFRFHIGNYNTHRSNFSEFVKFDKEAFSTVERRTPACNSKLVDKRGWWTTSECLLPGAGLKGRNEYDSYEEENMNEYDPSSLEYFEMKIRPTKFLKMSAFDDA